MIVYEVNTNNLELKNIYTNVFFKSLGKNGKWVNRIIRIYYCKVKDINFFIVLIKLTFWELVY